MSGQIIHDTQTKQEKTRTQQTHDHITHSGLDRASYLADHDKAAGGDRVDLHENISREHIIGVNQRQQRTQEQVDQDIVQVMLALFHLIKELVCTAGHG